MHVVFDSLGQTAKLVSQEWGKVVGGGRCGAMLTQPNLSARIGVKPLLVDVEAPHLSARIRVKSLLVGVAAPC